MGEIAEMMLDGTLCPGCGVVIESALGADGPAGFAQYCSKQCARDHGAGLSCDAPPRKARAQASPPRLYLCPECGKRFRHQISVDQHFRDKHGAAPDDGAP